MSDKENPPATPTTEPAAVTPAEELLTLIKKQADDIKNVKAALKECQKSYAASIVGLEKYTKVLGVALDDPQRAEMYFEIEKNSVQVNPLVEGRFHFQTRVVAEEKLQFLIEREKAEKERAENEAKELGIKAIQGTLATFAQAFAGLIAMTGEPARLEPARPAPYRRNQQRFQKRAEKQPVSQRLMQLAHNDWICEKCSHKNFGKNSQCRNCNHIVQW